MLLNNAPFLLLLQMSQNTATNQRQGWVEPHTYHHGHGSSLEFEGTPRIGSRLKEIQKKGKSSITQQPLGAAAEASASE